eukprot:XP_016664143.1 PREDICTED: uncharacterized PE-PGRS family protein PE_PGRS54-like [Acyrthosiphon pisum]
MELSFTLKWLPGSVVPIVTTNDTTTDTPFNVPPIPTELTRTINNNKPSQQQRYRDVELNRHGGDGDREPSVGRWRGGNRGWRGGNRGWRGGNRGWRGGNRGWRGGWNHSDGDERVRHVGDGNRERTVGGSGDRGRDGGAVHRERSAGNRERHDGAGNRERTVGGGDRGRDGGAVHRERSAGNRERHGGAGNRERTVGGGDRGRDGGAVHRERSAGNREPSVGDGNRERTVGGGDRGHGGAGNREPSVGDGNSERSVGGGDLGHGSKSCAIIALDRVPLDKNVPSTSGCGDGGKAIRPFNGYCTKCYEEGTVRCSNCESERRKRQKVKSTNLTPAKQLQRLTRKLKTKHQQKTRLKNNLVALKQKLWTMQKECSLVSKDMLNDCILNLN